MEYLIALAGNQNCGKTTLFNALTGSNQHVGNFPGVTVEKKEGILLNQKNILLVDLPGIYSLSPYTSEEIVTRDFLLTEHPHAIINIVDATNIERNLYLSLQLTELDIPMVIALNMMDEVRAAGNSIDAAKLSARLGVPVVPISAGKKEGLSDLITVVSRLTKGHTRPVEVQYHAENELRRTLHAITQLIEPRAKAAGYPPRFAAAKLIEGDPLINSALKLSDAERDILEQLIADMEKAAKTEREAILVDMRYGFIEKLSAEAVKKHRGQTKEQLRSERMDRILTHPVLAIPIFLLIMSLIFRLTFTTLGAPLQALMDKGIAVLSDAVSGLLLRLKVSEWLYALIIDGIFAGVGSVLSFLPVIVLLFFFLSLLEDSGYMARVAFIMDKLLRKIGLSGRSFVPMLIGFGCSVPAIMASRTLPGERDRRMTIVLTPFLSCSAKLPIYGMITQAFFPQHAGLVVTGLYLLGMIVAVLSGFLLKSTVFRGEPAPFVLELPAYRLPSLSGIFLHMWEKAKSFIRKAFTVIFIGTIVIWFLQSFDWSLTMVGSSDKSILASIGRTIAPLFAPLGFDDWRASTALLSGITAKEAVKSTLAVLTGATGDVALSGVLNTIFTPLSALSFLVFTILYMPCIAAFAATKRELGSIRGALATALFQTGVAYIMGLLVYRIGLLF